MINSKPFKYISSLIRSRILDKANQFIYIICLSVFLIVYNINFIAFKRFDVQSISRILDLLKYTIAVIMLFNAFFISGDYTLKEIILVSSSLIILFISYTKCHDAMLLFSAITIIGAKSVSFEKISKAFFYSYCCIFISVLVMCFSGAASDVVLERYGAVRHTLGYIHPNTLGLQIMVIQISMFLSFRDRINPVMFFLMSLAMAGFVYLVPNSRTSFMCILLVSIIPVFKNTRIMNNTGLKQMLVYIPSVIAVVSVVLTVYYDESIGFLSAMNRITTGRLHLANMFFKSYGWGGMFGMDTAGKVYDYFVDSAYCRLFLYFGLLAMFVFTVWSSIGLSKCIKADSLDIALVMIVVALYGVFEFYALFTVYNICLLTVSAIIDSGTMA